MGKYSDFERRPLDKYLTPKKCLTPLLGWLPYGAKFYEPCAHDGNLVRHLLDANMGFVCTGASDIAPADDSVQKKDALDLTPADLNGADFIITNPPWDRKLLHPMISHFSALRPTWLLFDADWMHNVSAGELMAKCAQIVSVGRVKWVEGSKYTSKENCCWYQFVDYPTVTEFVGRRG